jgi:hypothetical protein
MVKLMQLFGVWLQKDKRNFVEYYLNENVKYLLACELA